MVFTFLEAIEEKENNTPGQNTRDTIRKILVKMDKIGVINYSSFELGKPSAYIDVVNPENKTTYKMTCHGTSGQYGVYEQLTNLIHGNKHYMELNGIVIVSIDVGVVL